MMLRKPTKPPLQTQPVPRGIPSSEGRFCWQSSLALERIANEMGAGQAASGLAVYVTLCRLSSREKNNPTVQASIAKIAGMVRMSYRKCFQTLHDLETVAKVIAIKGQRISGTQSSENLYTLLTLKPHKGKPGGTAPRAEGYCKRDRTSFADNPKESSKEDIKKDGALAPGVFATQTPAPSPSYLRKGLDE